MDDPKSCSENIIESENDNLQEEGFEQEESEEENDKGWNINYNEECDFWKNLMNKGFIYIPEKCQTSNI